MKFDLDYEVALGVVRANDKEYAEDIETLRKLLRKRLLSADSMRDLNLSTLNDSIAELYEKRLIFRAEMYVQDEVLQHIKETYPPAPAKEFE